jgi:PAS domain S-box-containing protein
MINDKFKFTNNIIANKVIIGVALTCLLPIVAWVISLISHDIVPSLLNIRNIHRLDPVLFILDILPLLAAFPIYYYALKLEKDHKWFEEHLRERDEIKEKHAIIAKRIGEGNYNINFDIDHADLLGQSLKIMRDNLWSNFQKEREQNWIAKGKETVANILRLHNNVDDLAYDVIVNLIKYTGFIQGAIYIYDEEKKVIVNKASYAYNRRKFLKQEFRIGQGLIGQCAYEMDNIYRTEIPDDYVSITSGILGDKKPKSLLIVPLITNEKLQGVMEFASLEDQISEGTQKLLKELGEIIARTVFNLKVNEKTQKLLQEAQQMTEELRENEEELRQNAEEMRATQEELERSNEKLEAQVKEVENAQKRLYSLLENASEIISIYDKNQTLTYISPSVTKILGFTPEEMMKGKDVDRLTRKGEVDLKGMLNQLLENPTDSQTIQYTYMKKDGEKIFLECIGHNLLHDPAINGIILNSQDITERKRAEKEERMRTKMQALSENSLDVILRLNTYGTFYYANPVTEDYFGIKSDELINKSYKDIKINEKLKAYFEDTIQQIKSLPSKTNTQLTIQLLMGEKLTERILSIDAIPEFSENELETILFVGHDITEAKRIEQEIQDKNRKIQDSINYAQRIQSSILPESKVIRDYLPNSFVFYKPRDVVSGDFPWFFPKGDNIYIAAVDCTGHGVPGALLSFIGYFLLNNAVDHSRELTAGEICDQLHHSVRLTLKQDRANADARDGMDIALCKINTKKNEVQFSGAHRPLYHLRGKELTEYKGDRKAVGGIPHANKVENSFTNHLINVQPGDKIFFFSDGLTDQIGGEEKKKYSPQRIREAIVEYNDFSMDRFYNYFVKDLSDWQGSNKQIDDVLLIGIEF